MKIKIRVIDPELLIQDMVDIYNETKNPDVDSIWEMILKRRGGIKNIIKVGNYED